MCSASFHATACASPSPAMIRGLKPITRPPSAAHPQKCEVWSTDLLYNPLPIAQTDGCDTSPGGQLVSAILLSAALRTSSFVPPTLPTHLAAAVAATTKSAYSTRRGPPSAAIRAFSMKAESSTTKPGSTGSHPFLYPTSLIPRRVVSFLALCTA